MKKIILLILLFPALALAEDYKVVRVIDGDTIDIIYQGKKERNRMLFVDTPESVHKKKIKNTPDEVAKHLFIIRDIVKMFIYF